MYRFFKRLFDIIASGLAILVFMPIWLVVIAGILINDFGPIFYKARRIGKDDREFVMYKFRSMRVVKEQSVQTLRPEEDRIFAWGKVIRKLKLDEAPQLLNILFGDMSVVGPRPVAKDQFELFRIGKYDEAKSVRPGLTGPAALYDYIYGDQFEDSDLELYMEKVLPTRRELEYVYTKKKGILFDLKMIVWTVWCILCSAAGKMPKGIYDYLVGLAEEENESIGDRSSRDDRQPVR